ncbi:DNA methyltransferase [Halanaerobium sp. ST460_2HS_T2]|uniref:DNA methyltransferase n=1 Tax=Halanaerobium sp. ST460_2HS_T2 TaxID=2183914 RepID=UPI000DF39DB5|nr:DNA methyltransferase [Halanaerobium sp. ST460_2HS_T2]RCW60879.1 DNA methylase [Halanaerobium sp. ST460_2HS_T2]
MSKNFSFDKIPYDKSEIPQNKLNISDKKRSNLFRWNGQFSPQFIEVLLEKYSKNDFKIFDPFVGSGTVLHESGLKKLSAYGVEINPSAYYIASSYRWINFNVKKRKMIVKAIESMLKNEFQHKEINQNNFSYHFNKLLDLCSGNSEYLQLLSTFIILLDLKNKKINNTILFSKWKNLKETLINLPYSKREIIINNEDARRVSFTDDKFDLVITSPPYINVYNYHQQYRKSTELIGYDVLKIAKSEVGSNRKHRSNRFMTVVQYCIDMALVLKELSRVIKNKGRMIFVIGRESHIKGTKLYNSEIIYLLAKNCMNLNIINKQERFFKNRYGQMIYEDILHFENNKHKKTKEKLIIEAKEIAKLVLEETLNSADQNVKKYIIEAINKYKSISPSKLLKNKNEDNQFNTKNLESLII